jgi:phytoene dehydrogenase-like protein
LRANSEKWNVWRTKNGLQTFSETLEESLIKRGVEIHKNVKIEGRNTDFTITEVDFQMQNSSVHC